MDWGKELPFDNTISRDTILVMFLLVGEIKVFI
jgi:hypothetical protein